MELMGNPDALPEPVVVPDGNKEEADAEQPNSERTNSSDSSSDQQFVVVSAGASSGSDAEVIDVKSSPVEPCLANLTVEGDDHLQVQSDGINKHD